MQTIGYVSPLVHLMIKNLRELPDNIQAEVTQYFVYQFPDIFISVMNWLDDEPVMSTVMEIRWDSIQGFMRQQEHDTFPNMGNFVSQCSVAHYVATGRTKEPALVRMDEDEFCVYYSSVGEENGDFPLSIHFNRAFGWEIEFTHQDEGFVLLKQCILK